MLPRLQPVSLVFLYIGTGHPDGRQHPPGRLGIPPETRVVYVDYDPIVLAHARALLVSHEAGATDHSGRATQQRRTARSREEVARFFAGMDLVPPGVVRVEDWRPEPGANAGQSVLWDAVGRKR